MLREALLDAPLPQRLPAPGGRRPLGHHRFLDLGLGGLAIDLEAQGALGLLQDRGLVSLDSSGSKGGASDGCPSG